MVKLIRDGMRLDLRVRVALVNRGGPDRTPAWIERPDPFPRNGTPEFKQAVVTVFLRKSFLLKYKFEHVVMAIAHELSHVVLFRIRHPLEEVEMAVDLTAMLLGYSEFYFNGFELLHTERRGSLGYLTGNEIRYAAGVLGRPIEKPADAVRVKNKLISTLRSICTIAVAALVAIGLIWAGSSLFDRPVLEERPPIRKGARLSAGQIRYCLSEDIRISGARSMLNRYQPSAVDRFSGMVTDFNDRCGDFRYSAGELHTVRSEVEAIRELLWAAGVRAFSSSDNLNGH
ncbi:hypothetical protein [Bradyrhizobium sp. I1.14.4]|uniref:hypothetical protein n=1 Tax=unclassified Bradyrhizobium TaxID=2631580 RepID=UPI003D23D1E6